MKRCRGLTRVSLLQKQQNQNGRKSREIVLERDRIATSVFNARCSNLNFLQLVSRQLHYLDLTLTCPRIFVSILLSLFIFIEIPRPYGNFAPFMPSEPGSAMRHIIKPKIREIEY
jgi:hypothetical protein